MSVVVVLDNISNMTQREEIRKQLIEKANKKGFITYTDILELMPDIESDVALLDDIMDSLLEAGVEVVPGSGKEEDEEDTKASKDDTDDLMPTDQDEEDEDEEEVSERDALLNILKKDLTSDAGYQAALDTDDVVGLYLKEAGRVPLLTAEEEVLLAKRMEAAEFARQRIEGEEQEVAETLMWSEEQELRGVIMDGEKAQEHLIRANARLVISVAKKYIGRGVPFLDLIQEGNIGLIRATNKFEYQRGHKFSTYATWWIRQAVSRAVADQGRTIRVPVHMGDQLNRMRRVQLQLLQELGREPKIDELALEWKQLQTR